MGRREKHIRKLAAELGVTILLRPPSAGQSSLDHAERMRRVSGLAHDNGRADVYGWNSSKWTYFVALHELGHHACGHFPVLQNYWPRLLEAEAEAWDWAFKQSNERADRTIRKLLVENALGSYVRNHPQSTAGPVFHRLAAELGIQT